MTAREFWEALIAWSPSDRERSADGLVFGDPDREVRTVAVSLLATPRVLARAGEIGADLLLVHEPTIHGGVIPQDDPVMEAKRRLLAECGLPIYRFHDYAHFTAIDKINAGVLDRLGWEGSFDGQKRFTLRAPRPLSALIPDIGERLGLCHLRYMGAPALTVRTVACLFGAWGERNVYEQFADPEVDLVLAGEVAEWAVCEYVRDAGELGVPKGLLLLGHMGSERAGMEWIADRIPEVIPAVRTVYLDCGETYS